VRAVAGVCRDLGIPIGAEGVDDARQLELLRAQACAEVQGALFGETVLGTADV